MQRRWTTIAVVVAVAVVVSVLTYSLTTIQGTGAWFFDNRQVTEDTVKVGSFDFNLTVPAVGLISVDKLLPGGSSDQQVLAVVNQGDADFYYRFALTPDNAGSILWTGGLLELTITKGADVVYSGPIAGLNDFMGVAYQGLRLNSGDEETLVFQVSLNQAAELEYAGQSLQVIIDFHAIQAEALDN